MGWKYPQHRIDIRDAKGKQYHILVDESERDLVERYAELWLPEGSRIIGSGPAEAAPRRSICELF